MRIVRQESRLTQKALAERAGVSSTVVGMIERGLHQPRLDTLELLADALGIGIDEYIGREVKIG